MLFDPFKSQFKVQEHTDFLQYNKKPIKVELKKVVIKIKTNFLTSFKVLVQVTLFKNTEKSLPVNV